MDTVIGSLHTICRYKIYNKQYIMNFQPILLKLNSKIAFFCVFCPKVPYLGMLIIDEK